MNVDIWQRWTVGMVTTRGVVAQMLTSDMGHLQTFPSYQPRSGLPPEEDMAAAGQDVGYGPQEETSCSFTSEVATFRIAKVCQFGVNLSETFGGKVRPNFSNQAIAQDGPRDTIRRVLPTGVQRQLHSPTTRSPRPMISSAITMLHVRHDLLAEEQLTHSLLCPALSDDVIGHGDEITTSALER